MNCPMCHGETEMLTDVKESFNVRGENGCLYTFEVYGLKMEYCKKCDEGIYDQEATDKIEAAQQEAIQKIYKASIGE